MKKYKSSILAGVVALSLAVTFAFKTGYVGGDNYFELSKNMEIYAALVRETNTYYVDEIEPAKLINTGIDAMLKSLDPYTVYYSESEIEDYRFMTTGQYGGIGAQIGKRDEYPMVTEPYEGWPAQKADLRAGDVIMEIDGKSLKAMSSDEVSKLLKGQAGTDVKLLIQRPGEANPITKTVTRAEIKVKDVPYYGMINSHVGYLKFVGFHESASKEVKDALNELKKNPNLDGLVVDLRGNPGGLLDEAIKAVNIFVDKGLLVVSTKGKVDEWNKEYHTDDEPMDTKLPVVVLTDKGSASAAEILSGSLQDLDRAVVVGRNSFGKGLVQTSRPLPYNTQMKITVSKYYIPSGRCIQQIDYAHHDNEGKAVKFADSLRKAFKTKNGRTVYDGNGIAPDVKVEERKYADILQSLADKRLFFDYATDYRIKHATIAEVDKFKLTDADFQDFVAFTKTKEYKYTTETENSLQELEKMSKEDNYYTALKADLEDIKKKLDEDKKEDIYKYKQEILDILTQEVASRYYYAKGRIITSFASDNDIKESVKLFEDKSRYNSILSASK